MSWQTSRPRARCAALSFEFSPSNALDDLVQCKADIAIRMLRPGQQALLARRTGTLGLSLDAHRDYLARRGMPQPSPH